MSSKYDVTIFQPTGSQAQCACTRECSCSNGNADEAVAYNLLESTAARGGWQRVEIRPEISWFDSSNVVALTFKDRPPRIPESFLQVISGQSDETRDSTSESSLLEFHPGYARHSSCSGDADVAGATLSSKIASPGVHIEPVGSPECPTNDLSSRTTTQEINESAWCACPKLEHRSPKSKDLKLCSFKEVNLEQLKNLYKISYCQRGKWILKETRKSKRAKGLSIGDLWTKVCRFIKQGHLPHCNACYKKRNFEVWLYCDFIHCLKVRSILENGLGNIGVFSFSVHPHGVIMTV